MSYLTVSIGDNDFIPSLRLAVERLFELLIRDRREHYDGIKDHVPLPTALRTVNDAGLLVGWIDHLCQAEQMVSHIEHNQRGCYSERWECRHYSTNVYTDEYLKYKVSFNEESYDGGCATLVELNLDTGECLGYMG